MVEAGFKVPRITRPNAIKYHDPRPAYIKSLVAATQQPVPRVATLAGISRATLYRYINAKTPLDQLAPYPVQVVLEQLVLARISDDKRRACRREDKMRLASAQQPPVQ